MCPDTPLTRLDRRTVNRVIVGLIQKNGEPVTSQTRRNVLTKLKQFLNSCVSQELVSSNPAQTLSVSVVCRVPEVYTLGEVHRLLEVVQREPHRSLISYVTWGCLRDYDPPRLNG